MLVRSRASTSLTTTSLHSTAQMISSDQLKMTVPGLAQKDIHRTTENSAADKTKHGMQ